MSDQHPNGEEIARMLREQGPVQAPPDLADEVMRQVRTEAGTHRSKRRFQFRRPAVLVPALGLAAAAALVVGISHLGSMSSSESSSGAGGGTASAANGVIEKHPASDNLAGRFLISARAARSLSALGLVQTPKSTPPSPSTTAGSSAGPGYTPVPYAGAKFMLTVPSSQWSTARARLQALASAHARHKNEPSVLVVLRRKP